MSVKILWSGLTGRTGREAIEMTDVVGGVDIVAGLSRTDYEEYYDNHHRDTDKRQEELELYKKDPLLAYFVGLWEFNGVKWYKFENLNNITKMQPEGFDVLVDFSHDDVFAQVVELAVRTHVPLISGTSGLSDRHMAMLYDATHQIPVFRGGNFRFRVKKFIDEAVELAKYTDGEIILSENFYEGKSLPSETSKVIIKRIREEAGKDIELQSKATLPKDDLPCHWSMTTKHVQKAFGQGGMVVCSTTGFDELAHDVLEIAKVMATKPIKKGEFYDLDEIWDELPH